MMEVKVIITMTIEARGKTPVAEDNWFGGYKGGQLRWNTLKMKRQRVYRSRYKNNKMMRRILSTRISE
jgi:hypothetical protein